VSGKYLGNILFPQIFCNSNYFIVIIIIMINPKGHKSADFWASSFKVNVFELLFEPGCRAQVSLLGFLGPELQGNAKLPSSVLGWITVVWLFQCFYMYFCIVS
jgi:hypothetical protein